MKIRAILLSRVKILVEEEAKVLIARVTSLVILFRLFWQPTHY